VAIDRAVNTSAMPATGLAAPAGAALLSGALAGTEPGGTHCVADVSVNVDANLSIYVAPPGGGQAPELKITGSMSARALLHLSYTWQLEELSAGFHTCPSPPGPPGGPAWPVCPFFLEPAHWQPPAPPGSFPAWGPGAAAQIEGLAATFSRTTPPPGVGTWSPRPHPLPIPQGSTDGQPGFWSKPGSTQRANLPGDPFYAGTSFDASFEWGPTLQGAISNPPRAPRPGRWSRPLNLLGKSPTSPPGLQGLFDMIARGGSPTSYVGPLPHSDPPGWPCYYTGEHEGRVTVAATVLTPEVREPRIMNPANWPKVAWTECEWRRCASHSTFTPGATQVQHTALRPVVRYPIGVSAVASVSLTGPASRRFTLDLSAYARDLFERFPPESYWASGPTPLAALEQAIRAQAGPMLVKDFANLWAIGQSVRQEQQQLHMMTLQRLEEWQDEVQALRNHLSQGFQQLLDEARALPDLARTLEGRLAQHLDAVVDGLADPDAPHVLQAKAALERLLVERLPVDDLYGALTTVVLQVLRGEAPFTYEHTFAAAQRPGGPDLLAWAHRLWGLIRLLVGSRLPSGTFAAFEVLAVGLGDAIVATYSQGLTPLFTWLLTQLRHCFDVLGAHVGSSSVVTSILAKLSVLLAREDVARALEIIEDLVRRTRPQWDGRTTGGFERNLAALVAQGLGGAQ
jgi:hypothetical protein